MRLQYKHMVNNEFIFSHRHSALAFVAAQLQGAGIEPATREAQLLIQAVCHISALDWLRQPQAALTSAQQTALHAALPLRLAHMPLSRIVGERQFYGLNFKVSSAVLDPRPDTETIIDWVQTHLPAPQRILDLGTGSGCLAITLLTLYPQAVALAADISPAALGIAAHNARAHGVQHRWLGVCANWAAACAAQKFDLIVSNPPYIAQAEVDILEPAVQQYDPRLALNGGVDGFDCYRQIVPMLPQLLTQHGHVVFECGVGQTPALAALQQQHFLQQVGIVNDLAGHARCTVFCKP